jgi:hypothetical protein
MTRGGEEVRSAQCGSVNMPVRFYSAAENLGEDDVRVSARVAVDGTPVRRLDGYVGE